MVPAADEPKIEGTAAQPVPPFEKRHGWPNTITTDGLRSYGAAMKELGNTDEQKAGRWANKWVRNSPLPFRR